MSKDPNQTRDQLHSKIKDLRITVRHLQEDLIHHKTEHQKLVTWLKQQAPDLFKRALVELAFPEWLSRR